MAADSYSFLDIAALPSVRGHFGRGDALVLLSTNLEDVLWANGPGAALFGFPDIDALMDAPAPIGGTAKRQIAATKGFPVIGADRGVAVRLQSGMTSRVVPFLASSITLPDDATGILLSAPASEGASNAELAERALAGIAQPGQAAAIVDAEGQVIAASPEFGGFGLEQQLLHRLVAKAATKSEPLKQKVQAGERILPTGVAPLEGGTSLVIVTEDDFFDLPDEVMSAEDAWGTEVDPGEAVTFLPATGGEDVEEGRGVDVLLDAGSADGWYFSGADEVVAEEPEVPEARLAVTQGMPPVRFSWRSDGDGRLVSVSPEFSLFAGLSLDALNGLGFDEIAESFGVEGGHAVAALLRGRDTWSGRTVLWPVNGGTAQVPVDLAALPTYSRARSFEGFRGFGVVRTSDAALAAAQPEITVDGDPANAEIRAEPLASAFLYVDAEDPEVGDDTLKGDSDRVVQLLSASRFTPGEAELSPDERDAFLEIGARLMDGESGGQEPASPAEPARADAAPEIAVTSPEMDGPPAADDGTADMQGHYPSAPEMLAVAAISEPPAADADEISWDEAAGPVDLFAASWPDRRDVSSEDDAVPAEQTATSPGADRDHAVLAEGEAVPSASTPDEATAQEPLAAMGSPSPVENDNEPVLSDDTQESVGVGSGVEAPSSHSETTEEADAAPQEGPAGLPSSDGYGSEQAPDDAQDASDASAHQASDDVPQEPEAGDGVSASNANTLIADAPDIITPGRQAASGDAEARESGVEAATAPQDGYGDPENSPDGKIGEQPAAAVESLHMERDPSETAEGAGAGTRDGDRTTDPPDGMVSEEESASALLAPEEERQSVVLDPVDFAGEAEPLFPVGTVAESDAKSAAATEFFDSQPTAVADQLAVDDVSAFAPAPTGDAAESPDTRPLAAEAQQSAPAGVPLADIASFSSPASQEGVTDADREIPAADDPLHRDMISSGRIDDDRSDGLPTSDALAAASLISTEGEEDESAAVRDEAGGEEDQPDTSVLDRLPVPVLIHSGDWLHYANPEFLTLADYPSLAAFAEAGGLGCLFTAPWERIGDAGDRTLRLRTGGGEEFPVEALLRTVPWRGNKALLLVLRRLEGTLSRDDAETAELGQRLTEMRAIIDTATDGVVLIGPEGTIRSISRPAEALFGRDSAEAAGRPFTSLFASESQRTVAAYLDGLASDGVASVMNDGREVIGREAKGGFIPLFMTIGVLPDHGGFCAVLRDITQWKRAEEELTQSRALAERASTHKTEFLARVSHEIRTPLNAIIGFSELMLNEKFGPVGSDRYRDYLRDINRSGNHVLDLVNDLLDISKIEAGQQEMSYEAVALNDALGETVATMQPQANRERVIIRSSFASKLPDVVADPRSVRQIALNILSNAVRFTQAGGQVIVSTAYDASGDVVMRVRDTGIGMSQAEIEQALKPFKQINSLKRTRGDGTGLGLPLTKAMVEANRARFAISSDPGIGTMVEVTFPATRVLAE